MHLSLLINIDAYIYIYIPVYVYMYIYSDVYKYIHTYFYAYTCRQMLFLSLQFKFLGLSILIPFSPRTMFNV